MVVRRNQDYPNTCSQIPTRVNSRCSIEKQLPDLILKGCLGQMDLRRFIWDIFVESPKSGSWVFRHKVGNSLPLNGLLGKEMHVILREENGPFRESPI